MTQFYCYIHKKQDGTPFYVGKGSKNRAFSFGQRSNWHKNIVAKEGGPKNIQIELYNATDEYNAFVLEQIFIKGLSLFFDLCNLTKGGDGPSGAKRSATTKAKISAAVSGVRHPNFGKSLSAVTKQKISLANSGKPLSQETKQKLSDAHKGKTHSVSEATREKLRIANSGERGSGAKLSKQEVLEIRDLYKHKIFSQRQLAKMYGICRSQVVRIIRYSSWKE